MLSCNIDANCFRNFVSTIVNVMVVKHKNRLRLIVPRSLFESQSPICDVTELRINAVVSPGKWLHGELLPDEVNFPLSRLALISVTGHLNSRNH